MQYCTYLSCKLLPMEEGVVWGAHDANMRLMARKNAMKFVMLTVFKNNLTAMQFYRLKMKYDVDETVQACAA